MDEWSQHHASRASIWDHALKPEPRLNFLFKTIYEFESCL